MVYEYNQNSGIDRSAFPSSCTSFTEMGLYVTAETTRDMNKIFQEAGIIELNHYKNIGLMTEAEDVSMGKKIIQKVVKLWQEFWKRVMAIWEKISDWFNVKVAEYSRKLGSKFKELDLRKADEQTLAKIAGNARPRAIDAFNEADKMIKGIDRVVSEFKIDVVTSSTSAPSAEKRKTFIDSTSGAYATILSKLNPDEFGGLKNKEEVSVTAANAAIDKYLDGIADSFKNAKKSWVALNKDEIAKLITDNSKKSINDAYKISKKLAAKTEKDLHSNSVTSTDESLRYFTRAELYLGMAAQNMITHLIEYKKKMFTEFLGVAARAVAFYKVKEVTGESVETNIKYNDEFVNEVFNW